MKLGDKCVVGIKMQVDCKDGRGTNILGEYSLSGLNTHTHTHPWRRGLCHPVARGF